MDNHNSLNAVNIVRPNMILLIKRLFIAVLLYLFTTVLETYANSIYGNVLNMTNNMPVPNTLINLIEHSDEKDAPIRFQWITDEEGYFEFDHLSTDKGTVYFITFNYKDTPYIVENLTLNDKKRDIKLTVPVYETSADDKDIVVNEYNIFITFKEGNLLIEENILAVNTGQTVFIGGDELSHGKMETYRIELPLGSRDIKYIKGLDEDSAFRTGWGILLTAPIKPGKLEIKFSYLLKSDSDVFDISRRVFTNTKSIDVFIEDRDITVEGTNLKAGTSKEIGEVTFYNLDKDNVAKGEEIKLKMKFKRGNKAFHIAASLAVILLICAGVMRMKS